MILNVPFHCSNLTQLIKLHLEQNEISEFHDPNVFCDLPNLLDLYLGDNALTALHFNISCLHNLRFLDLQRNKFKRILERDLHAMDTIVKHNQQIVVDFTGNPLECSCKLNPFINWMKKTKVFVRNKNNLMCYKGINLLSYSFCEILIVQVCLLLLQVIYLMNFTRRKIARQNCSRQLRAVQPPCYSFFR